jgi:hypothetical protein
MKDWLVKCDKLVKLIFNPKVKIKGLSASKGYFPISMENKLIVE